MFILPVSATAFMINLNQKYPVIEPYLPYAIDGKSSLGVDSVDSTPFKFLVKWWLSISQTSWVMTRQARQLEDFKDKKQKSFFSLTTHPIAKIIVAKQWALEDLLSSRADFSK
jgi:hypothetical protein